MSRYQLATWALTLLFALTTPSLPITQAQETATPDGAVSVLVEPPTTQRQQRQQRGPRGQRIDNSPLDAAKVRKAIDRAMMYLRDEQLDSGAWPNPKYPEGTTALCALAMLNAGEPADSQTIKKAIDYIRRQPRFGTYFISLRIMVFAAADPKGKKYFADIKRDVEWLLRTMGNDGDWGYGNTNSPSTVGDGSNSQFALLALHEASRVGVKVKNEDWQKMKSYWEGLNRKSSGGFGYYRNGQDARGSMTCAGISSWIIIQENLADPLKEVNGDFAVCCRPNPELAVVEAGIKWLAEYYSVRTNPGGYAGTVLYYLYGLERAGRLSGRRFIGANDWYRDGAKRLLFWQNKDGYWRTANGHGEENSSVATAFALLFLSKGKRPVAIGKFDHGAADWDQHPKGVHLLTRRLEDEWNMKLNWQTVRAENSSVDDLLEAPVLFMSGKQLIQLTAQQKENLKLYLENGGFLFAEACGGDGCGNADVYDRSFKELMAELFPESPLAPLEITHPIWGAHYPLSPNPDRPMLGLQACCRTSVVYCPKNLSCYWALDRPAVRDNGQIQEGLKQRVEYCSRLGVNVIAYATNRQLKEKGETPTLKQENVEVLAERALVFPKLLHGGGADDAPNAWNRILEDTKQLGLEMNMEKKMIAPTYENLKNYPLVFMHGRRSFEFTKEQRQALRDHIELGGFLFADSICASQEFTDAFRKEIAAILGQPLRPIPPDHEIWTNPRFGRQITQVTLRSRDPKVRGGFREDQRPPELEGIEVNGQLVVIFSPYDLSCALENTSVSQCTGYTRNDAIKIGTNVILYSMLSESSPVSK